MHCRKISLPLSRIAVIVCEITAMLKGLGEASVSPFACRSFHDVSRPFPRTARKRPHGDADGVIPYPLGETALNRKENGPMTAVAARHPSSRRTGGPPGGGLRPGPLPVGRPPVLRCPGFLYLRAGNPSSFGVVTKLLSVFIVCSPWDAVRSPRFSFITHNGKHRHTPGANLILRWYINFFTKKVQNI